MADIHGYVIDSEEKHPIVPIPMTEVPQKGSRIVLSGKTYNIHDVIYVPPTEKEDLTVLLLLTPLKDIEQYWNSFLDFLK